MDDQARPRREIKHLERCNLIPPPPLTDLHAGQEGPFCASFGEGPRSVEILMLTLCWQECYIPSMNERPDVLIASPKKTSRLPRLASSWRPRTASLDSLLKGQTPPAQITILDIDTPAQLKDLGAFMENLKRQPEAIHLNFVILSFGSPESREEKIRLLAAFPSPERVEISEDPGQVLGLLDNVAAKIEALSMQKPQPSPLDEVKAVVAATSRLREKNGNLSAVSIARLYGASVAQLADWLGRSRQTVSRTPDADSLQDKLEYFERVARLLTVLPEEEFRKWLRMPNPNLSNESPMDWIAQNRWQALADLVDDMLTGAPS